MKNKLLLPIVLFLAFNAERIAAHDYWLEAKSFFVNANSEVKMRMLVGTRLVVEEEKPFQLNRTVLMNLFARGTTLDLLANARETDVSPAVTFETGRAGNYLVAMERNPAFITLEADKFVDYLREEGLEKVIAERTQRGEDKDFGRERYRRYLKTLIQAGRKRDETYKKIVGLKLEILPLENPYRKAVGDKLRFRVLFDGAPLTNCLLWALNRQEKEIFAQKARTDEHGETEFTLDRAGFWLVRTVEMRRCTENCQLTEWNSYWGSFSFGIE